MNSSQDVLIIGGGVIGLSIARDLHKKGAGPITIVDRGLIGGEASWAAAGMLAPNIETDTSEGFHRFGIESLELYPNFAAELLEETGVDIELDRSGTLCVAFDAPETSELSDIYERQRARSVQVERLSGSAVRDIEPSVSPLVLAALLYPNDWQVENRILLTALRKYARINGIRIIEDTEVRELISDGTRIIGAKTSAGDIHAGVTVIATGAWTSLIKIDGVAVSDSVRPIRGQMISVDTGSRRIRRVIYSPRGYVVPRADGRVLVGATVEDVGFDKSTTRAGVESLRDAGTEIIPFLKDFAVAEEWAGLRPFSPDGLPVIGDLPGYQNVLIATSHYRNGILLAPKTAKVISERILDGVISRYFELYGVGRFSSAAHATFNC
jgi:glycine oxidase